MTNEAWKTPLLFAFCGVMLALTFYIFALQFPKRDIQHRCSEIGARYAFQRDGVMVCRMSDGTLVAPWR